MHFLNLLFFFVCLFFFVFFCFVFFTFFSERHPLFPIKGGGTFGNPTMLNKRSQNNGRTNNNLPITGLVNSGTSWKRRYRYFVQMAHPGTFEIAPKDKKIGVNKCRSQWLL